MQFLVVVGQLLALLGVAQLIEIVSPHIGNDLAAYSLQFILDSLDFVESGLGGGELLDFDIEDFENLFLFLKVAEEVEVLLLGFVGSVEELEGDGVGLFEILQR